MTKLKAIIHLDDISPEDKEHAQQILDKWTKFNPLEIEVVEVIKEGGEN